ncbi:hypothetical protein WR25_12716 isoform A [Diploscapter pachys]|uniref:ShKT domain-containing protein n=1 Tax=Diploscapter pachys TaxID=2018661 RepID=A0A2A2LLJ4_9BILA|nr:hypothetical protein WR25_12716 isoform A [Diploscapter pachys]
MIIRALHSTVLLYVGSVLAQSSTTVEEELPTIYKFIQDNSYICNPVLLGDGSLVTFLTEEQSKNCSECNRFVFDFVPNKACATRTSGNQVETNTGCFDVPQLCVEEYVLRYSNKFPTTTKPRITTRPTTITRKSLPTLIPTTAFVENEVETTTIDVSIEHNDARDLILRQLNSIDVDKVDTDSEDGATNTISPIATSVLPEYGFEDITDEGTFNEDASTLLPFFASSQRPPFVVARTPPPGTRGEPPPRHLGVVPESRSQPPPPIVEIQPTEPPPMDYSEEAGDNQDLLSSTERPIHPSTQMILEHLNTGQPEELSDDELLMVGAVNTMQIPQKKDKLFFFGTTTTVPTITTPYICEDKHPLCCFWAVTGECDSNPFWMRVRCAKTCGTCQCDFRHADKCVSTGINCTLPTTTTTTTTYRPRTYPTYPTAPPRYDAIDISSTVRTYPSSKRTRPTTTLPFTPPLHGGFGRTQKSSTWSTTSTTTATTTTTTTTTVYFEFLHY